MQRSPDRRRNTDGDLAKLVGGIKLDSASCPASQFPTMKRINEQSSTTRLSSVSGLAGRLKAPPIPVQTSYSHTRRKSYAPPQRLIASRLGRTGNVKLISGKEIKQTKAELKQMSEESRARQSAQANVPDWANYRPVSRPQQVRKEPVPMMFAKDVKVIDKGSSRDVAHQIV